MLLCFFEGVIAIGIVIVIGGDHTADRRHQIANVGALGLEAARGHQNRQRGSEVVAGNAIQKETVAEKGIAAGRGTGIGKERGKNLN